MSISGVVVAASGIGGKPDPNGLPGSPALQQLVNGLAFWGLLAALAGLVISAAIWALSAHSGNYHDAAVGRRGTLVSAAAAFLVGAAPAIVSFFEDLGHNVTQWLLLVAAKPARLGRGGLCAVSRLSRSSPLAS